MAKNLRKHIDELKGKILEVGTLVEEAIAKAISALVSADPTLAQAVIDADDVIDQREIDVEEEVLQILALFQPVAADLRFVISVLKINNDLERMGDLARNIAKRVVSLARSQRIDLPIDFQAMAARSQSMVRQSLDALVRGDAELARKVRDMDDEIDEMKRANTNEVEKYLAQHPEHTDYLVRLMSVLRHLERLADLATNIAEDVIYMVQGEIVRHQHQPRPASASK